MRNKSGQEPPSLGEQLEELDRKLFGYALSLTKHIEDAKDLVQKTILRIWERKEQYDPSRSLFYWALRICRNIHFDDVRKKDVYINGATNPKFLQIPDYLAGRIAFDRLSWRDFQRCFDRLPLKQQDVVLMWAFDMKYQEIADGLKIPKGTVTSRLSRGRISLKTCTEGEVS